MQSKNSTVWGLRMWGELFFTSMTDYQDMLVDPFLCIFTLFFYFLYASKKDTKMQKKIILTCEQTGCDSVGGGGVERLKIIYHATNAYKILDFASYSNYDHINNSLTYLAEKCKIAERDPTDPT